MTPKLPTADRRTGPASGPKETSGQAKDAVGSGEIVTRPQPIPTWGLRALAEPRFLDDDVAPAKAPDLGVVPLGSGGVRQEPPAPAAPLAPAVRAPVAPAPRPAPPPVARPVAPLPPNPYEAPLPAPPPRATRAPAPEPHTLDDVRPTSWVRPRHAPRVAFRAGRVVAALYAFGGLAPLALSVGPRQFFWAAVAIVSLTTYVTVAWFWTPLRSMMATARLPLVPFLAVLFIAHAAGALAWSRALARTIRDPRYAPRDLPHWVRHPFCAVAGGFLLPGFGYVVTGFGKRAALAFWNAATVIFAALVLSHASLLWSWNERSAADALPRQFVEALLLGSAGIVFFGGLAWIGGALDGLRLALGHRPFAQHPRLVGPGDAASVGLLIALAIVALCIRPTRLAADLDSIAGAMRYSNYQLVPLTFERAASALDPARPEYTLRVAALYGEMGRPEKARAIQDRLRERWDAYARLVLANGTAPAATAPAPAVAPSSMDPNAAPAGH